MTESFASPQTETSDKDRTGLLIILSSPSGAGKSTLSRALMAWDTDISFSVSATTRAPRIGEQDGRDYYFYDEAEFKSAVAEGQMLEHAQVFGNYYGSPRAPVEDAIRSGRDVLFDIDWQGAQQIRNTDLNPHVLSIFILPPSIKALHDRLTSRGTDDAGTIAKRMRQSWDEISHWDGYDYVLINDDLAATEEKLLCIIAAERMRRARQPGLLPFVRGLQGEFQEGGHNDL